MPLTRSTAGQVRARLPALDAASPWLPAAIGAGVLAATTLVALFAPAGVRGDAVLATASLTMLLAYAAWPKPALLVFALFVLFDQTLARWLSDDLRHVDEVLVPLLFVAALLRTRPWQRGLIEPLRDGALLVMFVASVGSSLISGVPFSVWLLGLFLLLKVFAFLYVVVWHDFNARDLRQLYPLVIVLGLAVLALVPFEINNATLFHQVLNLADTSAPREGLPSVRSVFYQPEVFAWLCAFIGLYLVAGYVVLRRPILLVGAALFAVGTILAARRRAIVGVAVALLGGVIQAAVQTRSQRATARAWWPAIAGAVLVVVVYLPSLTGLASVTITPDPSAIGIGSPDARAALYSTSVAIARDNFPFGAGLGRYGSGVSRDPYSPIYEKYGLDKIDGLSPTNSSFASDTFWPRILGETGLIGLVALIVFTLVLGVQVWNAARAPAADGLTRAFLLGTWIVFVQAIVETLASSMFDSPPRIYLLFGAIGVCLSLARQPAEDRGWSSPSGVASMPSLRAAK